MQYIGIDVGIHNGFAVWDKTAKRIIELDTYKTWEVITCLLVKKNDEVEFTVRIENPNTWVNYRTLTTKEVNARKQGAGSVKRSYQVLIEFFEDNNIKYEAISLRSSLKKLKADKFKMLTGIDVKTNEHERDACMMVFGI